jgi:hypothetical protein
MASGIISSSVKQAFFGPDTITRAESNINLDAQAFRSSPQGIYKLFG